MTVSWPEVGCFAPFAWHLQGHSLRLGIINESIEWKSRECSADSDRRC